MSNQLTIDELRAYQAGLLSGPEQHRVEQLLLEDPFYADALEGLEALQQSGKSLTKQTTELRNALHERIHESATERRLMPLWMTSATASVILVMCVAIYLIYFTKPAFQPISTTKPMVFEVELTPATPAARAAQSTKQEPTVEGSQQIPATASPMAALPISFAEFVATNRQIPSQPTPSRVTIRFKVPTHGSIRRIQLVKAANHTLNTEAIRLIRTYPYWPKGWQQISIDF